MYLHCFKQLCIIHSHLLSTDEKLWYQLLNKGTGIRITPISQKLRLFWQFADLNWNGYDDLLIGAPLHSADWTELIPRFLNTGIGEKNHAAAKWFAPYVKLPLNLCMQCDIDLI